MSVNVTTQPAIGLSLLCLLLDVAKQLHEEEEPAKEFLIVNHRYFYDTTFNYGSIDRVGGVLSHLCRVFKNELVEALGEGHDSFQQQQQANPQQVPESSNLLRDIYSTVFLVRNNNDTGSYSLVQNIINEQLSSTNETPISSGKVNHHKSICEIIDCCIMFFQSVAYKYIQMISELRDNISHLSNILIETKNCRDEVLKNLEEYKHSIEGFSSSQEEVLRELSEKFCERKNIFAVSS